MNIQINIHKEKLNHLNIKMNNTEDTNYLALLNNQIKSEQEFIDSLLNIHKKLNKENQVNLIQNKADYKIVKNITEEENKCSTKELNVQSKEINTNKKISETIDKNKKKEFDIKDIIPFEDKIFYYYHNDPDIYTKYIRQVKNKLPIYFQCSKINGCLCSIKYKVKNKN